MKKTKQKPDRPRTKTTPIRIDLNELHEVALRTIMARMLLDPRNEDRVSKRSAILFAVTQYAGTPGVVAG